MQVGSWSYCRVIPVMALYRERERERERKQIEDSFKIWHFLLQRSLAGDHASNKKVPGVFLYRSLNEEERTRRREKSKNSIFNKTTRQLITDTFYKYLLALTLRREDQFEQLKTRSWNVQRERDKRKKRKKERKKERNNTWVCFTRGCGSRPTIWQRRRVTPVAPCRWNSCHLSPVDLKSSRCQRSPRPDSHFAGYWPASRRASSVSRTDWTWLIRSVLPRRWPRSVRRSASASRSCPECGCSRCSSSAAFAAVGRAAATASSPRRRWCRRTSSSRSTRASSCAAACCASEWIAGSKCRRRTAVRRCASSCDVGDPPRTRTASCRKRRPPACHRNSCVIITIDLDAKHMKRKKKPAVFTLRCTLCQTEM